MDVWCTNGRAKEPGYKLRTGVYQGVVWGVDILLQTEDEYSCEGVTKGAD